MRKISKIENDGSPLKCVVLTSSVRKKLSDCKVSALASAFGNTIELKSAPSSPSRSPTPCRFKHSHLASRVSQGERRVNEG
jgi:hypothetical protein